MRAAGGAPSLPYPVLGTADPSLPTALPTVGACITHGSQPRQQLLLIKVSHCHSCSHRLLISPLIARKIHLSGQGQERQRLWFTTGSACQRHLTQPSSSTSSRFDLLPLGATFLPQVALSSLRSPLTANGSACLAAVPQRGCARGTGQGEVICNLALKQGDDRDSGDRGAPQSLSKGTLSSCHISGLAGQATAGSSYRAHCATRPRMHWKDKAGWFPPLLLCRTSDGGEQRGS